MKIKSQTAPSPGVRGLKTVSVEALVRWAYADIRVDRLLMTAPGPAGFGDSGLGQLLALGTAVDSSRRLSPPGFADGERVPQDAATVHAVVTGGYLTPVQAELVRMHGRLRSRPDPRLGARHRWEPAEWRYERRAPGSDEYLRVAVAEYLNRRQCWYVPIVQKDKPDEVARDRERWMAWCEGLATVLAVAGPKLEAHALTEEFPDPAPWLPPASERDEAGA